jgi:prepilin-type N-terminal cleavage/methylation domain-containing protein
MANSRALTPRTGLAPRAGFTLLEALVVLVLLATLSALAAPALIPQATGREGDGQRVVDEARRTALRRGAAVTVSFEADGRWTIRGGGFGESAVLAAGTLGSDAPVPLRLHVSALGACTVQGFGAAPTPRVSVDPVRCRIRGS